MLRGLYNITIVGIFAFMMISSMGVANAMLSYDSQLEFVNSIEEINGHIIAAKKNIELGNSEQATIHLSHPIGMFNSELSSQNLKGDIITLNKYWKISKGSTLNINIINSASISEQVIDVIKNTIISTKTVEIDNSFLDNQPTNSVSTYYMGWKGALQNTEDLKIPIPKNFKINNSPNVYGDIIVILSNIKDRSGNSGYTETVLDGEKIVKAFITIYEVDVLTKNELVTIMRHEFGHALGLGHATDNKDLMAPTIDMTYPFISQCNIMAMSDLYNEKSGVTTC